MSDTEYEPCQTSENACVGIVIVHVLKRRCRSCFSEIDHFVTAVGGSHDHEAAATDATVITTDDTSAEYRADKLD